MTKPKEAAYDEHVSPLMSKIIKLCEEHKINMAAQFALDVAEEGEEHTGPLYCTTVLQDVDKDCADSIERMMKLRRVMYPPHPHFAAFTIIGGAKP